MQAQRDVKIENETVQTRDSHRDQNWGDRMRTLDVVVCLVLALVMVVLSACGGSQTTEMSDIVSTADTGDGIDEDPEGKVDQNQTTGTSGAVSSADQDEVLKADYQGALDAGGQLALGTLLLEETNQPVTPEQARELLPLWQALQGGVTAEAEVSAVLTGVEKAMTSEQLAVIADMKLTQEDVQGWMQDQRQTFGAPHGSTDLSGERPTGQGGEAAMGNLSEEDREAMLATRQAGGGMPGGGVDAVGGAGQYGMLLRPLIAMLEANAGEA
jgi:hypothetical protein